MDENKLTFGPGQLRDVTVGAVAEAEEVSVRVFALLRRGMADPRRTLSGGAEMGMTTVRTRITALAERGALERTRGWDWATARFNAAVRTVAGSPPVDRAVDVQVERVLRPLVAKVLDDILDMLERDPERIRALVRSQRTSMVDELMDKVRSGAAAGDTSVDRITSKVLRVSPPGDR